MVDFNNETTIGTSAWDIVRVLILQRRNDLIEAIEYYNKLECRNTDGDLSIVQARLHSLFNELQASLKRRWNGPKDTRYKDLIDKIKSDKFKDIIDAFYILNEYLDEINLTRIDTRKQYDGSRVEEENKERGLG